MTNFEPCDQQKLFQFLTRLKTHLESYAEGETTTITADALLPSLTTTSQLAQLFHLSAFEQLILLLTIAQELDPSLQTTFARIQGKTGKSYATLELALLTLPEANWSVLSPQCPLHHWQLIHTAPGASLTQTPITIDRRILCYILGVPARPPALEVLLTPLTSESISQTLPASLQNRYPTTL